MKPYFEGWYFKQEIEGFALALIPARHRDEHGKEEASLQIVLPQATFCIPFDIAQMEIRRNPFEVRLGKNRFSKKGIHLDVESKDISLLGNLTFGPFAELNYDIMGPFLWVPGMECKHSVLSMRHCVAGSLHICGEKVDFLGGWGYIEGDRGVSFPKSYLWTQCSFHSQVPGALMLSVAEIPYCGIRFTGVIGVVRLGERELRLATYLGAKVLNLGEGKVEVAQGKYRLYAEKLDGGGVALQAPTNGCMQRSIRESLACSGRYCMKEEGQVLFDFIGNQVSFEYEF